MKEALERQLNALLDVGFATRQETTGFTQVLHDDFLSALQQWLYSYGENWLEAPEIVITQGLNDHGVDLIATFRRSDYKVGFQVWSNGDVRRKDLMQDVWRQIGEAGSLGLNTFYVILCADMVNRSQYQKVRLFVNQVEQGEYRNRIELIPPEKAWTLYEAFSQPIDNNEIQRRITTFTRFMHAIGRGQELQLPDSIYAHLDSLYLPPTQYPTIQEKLESHNIVVIVGQPHTGKTITAVKLLYEYFQKLYQPFWVLNRIGENKGLSSLRAAYHQEHIHDSFSLEAMIRAGSVLYLEDPYGSTTQEEIDFINSERRFDIDEIIQLVERRSQAATKPPKVIITAREGIYYRALEEQPELAEYAVLLTVGDDSEESVVSYNFLSRAEIAVKYVGLYKPKWCNKNAAEENLETLEEILSWAASFLWTPHSLQTFFFKSRDTELRDGSELKVLVRDSISIGLSFASEIGLLSVLEQFVLVVIYLENRAENLDKLRTRANLRDKYYSAVLALGFQDSQVHRAWTDVTTRYSTLFEHLEKKILQSEPIFSIRFIHPAYLEAVANFLSEHPQILDTLFLGVRHLLQTESGLSVAEDLTTILHHWYRSRPRLEAQVLEGYLTSPNSSLLQELAYQYSYWYPFIEDDYLRQMIEALARHPIFEHYEGRRVFVQAAQNFDRMSIAARCKILEVALDVNPTYLLQKARSRPFDLVCQHYGEVTEVLRGRMEEFVALKPDSWIVVGRSFGQYYDLLPNHLRQITDDWSMSDDGDAFFRNREIIIGLTFGFGETNNNAHHLVSRLLASNHLATRAYAVRSLVPVYHAMSSELQEQWQQVVTTDQAQCAAMAANHIISLSHEELLRDKLDENRLIDFALELASSTPVVRAEMLRVLQAAPETLANRTVPLVQNLLFDDTEVVRAAALYAMLESPSLAQQFPERFHALMQDNSDYSQISRLIYYLNVGGIEPIEAHRELDVLRDSTSPLVRNAFVFHLGSQVALLPESWRDWLNRELQTQRANDIMNAISLKSTADVKRIYLPHWYIDYLNVSELRYYEPELAKVVLPSAIKLTFKMIDEVELFFATQRVMSMLKGPDQ